MKRLFPRAHTALVMAGYMPDEANLVLRDARRGDWVALMKVRLAAQLQRPTLRENAKVLELIEARL